MLTCICCGTQNKMAINDFITIQTLFDKLNKQLEKTQKVSEPSALPRAYVRLLVELEVRISLSTSAYTAVHSPQLWPVVFDKLNKQPEETRLVSESSALRRACVCLLIKLRVS